MARKGVTVWAVSKTVPGDGFNYVTTYALNTDGKLVKKLQTKELNGRSRHDYGWTVRFTANEMTRRGADAVLASLRKTGYSPMA